MLKKIDYKNTFFQLAVGLIAYFLFIKEKSVSKLKPILNVGSVVSDGRDYTPIYFKESEYLGKYSLPIELQGNLSKLLRVLDTIRTNFGSAILIKRGYSPSITGIITNKFETCESVEIYPQNGKLKELNKLVLSLKQTVNLDVVENYIVAGNLKISINGY